MIPDNHNPSAASHRRILIAQLAAFGCGLAVAIPFELDRLRASTDGGTGFAQLLVGVNIDVTPILLWFLLVPLFWWNRRPLFDRRSRWLVELRRRIGFATASQPGEGRSQGRRAWVLALCVGGLSLSVSAGIASLRVGPDQRRYGDLPPAFHDEYSYLFQARTFLAGRLSFPSHPKLPRLFDQMHVLNEGRFASRYFPGTGAWLAPFLAIGKPYWGHWLAGAISATFVFAIGRELAGDGVGLLAGTLTALSPGMGLFSNLLLAHHPTLVGLTLFIFAFLRMQRTQLWGWALLAGTGLTFAALCRPMTAAGVGLPFGLWCAWWLIRGGRVDSGPAFGQRLRVMTALGVPIALGLLALCGYNRAITGKFLTTPYQLFTEIYTPRHVYGFDNVVRGEKRLGPRVIENYDRWAENLTPSMAAHNTWVRLLASCQWALGVIPLLLATVVFVVAGGASDRRWWFVPSAIVSLFAVHVPYWYVGTMHFHYVFESLPLWCLLFAAATSVLTTYWRDTRRGWMPVWWMGIVVAAVLVAYVPANPLWSTPRLMAGINELAFPRLKYDRFRRYMDSEVTQRPALVLIDADPHDRHMDYVVNDPQLNSPVLFGRLRADVGTPNDSPSHVVASVARSFPDRSLYLFRATDQRLFRLVNGGLHEFVDGPQSELNSVGEGIHETFIALRPVEAVDSHD